MSYKKGDYFVCIQETPNRWGRLNQLYQVYIDQTSNAVYFEVGKNIHPNCTRPATDKEIKVGVGNLITDKPKPKSLTRATLLDFARQVELVGWRWGVDNAEPSPETKDKILNNLIDKYLK